MNRPKQPDAEILTTPIADRVLERASELDALRKTGTSVADLRSAVTEAGISDAAFDAAMGEVERSTARQGSKWMAMAAMAGHAPRVITIRGTDEQFRQIRALFDRYEGAATSCPTN
jgi:hypothetical protein